MEMENVNFTDLIERLNRLESLVEFSNTIDDKVDYLYNPLFKHLVYIYFYGNRTNNFHHWCAEISNIISLIMNSKVKKGGKRVTSDIVIKKFKPFFDTFENTYNLFMEQVINKEGLIDISRYKNKSNIIKKFLEESIVSIIKSNKYDLNDIEDFLNGYIENKQDNSKL